MHHTAKIVYNQISTLIFAVSKKNSATCFYVYPNSTKLYASDNLNVVHMFKDKNHVFLRDTYRQIPESKTSPCRFLQTHPPINKHELINFDITAISRNAIVSHFQIIFLYFYDTIINKKNFIIKNFNKRKQYKLFFIHYSLCKK